MMSRKEYLDAIRYVTDEERYKQLIRLISSRLDRDLTRKEIRFIHWLAGLDETCEVFVKLLGDIGKDKCAV
ncbi:hypothetical protein FB550_10988 [Neobacillus bataviensis]|uniref:Uncharacterized protein n=1 Tax=Neobacillus bataviensis TaxID=220685 RepID=A0A561D5I3_9BACI|nr:hypothetical protein [Neobacillus bataviensis]TWD98582.1 hypothetical protein FB550_10988 [Neobacillus bataviensis]